MYTNNFQSLMRRVTAVATVVVAVLTFSEAAFAGVLYGSSRSAEIFSIDTVTGAGTLVGQIPGLGATEIEHDNTTGRSWSQLPDGSFANQEFDIFTGSGIGAPISNGHAFNGLEYVGATLYGAEIDAARGSSELRTLDPTTGISVLIGATGVGPIAGLAYDVGSDIMYGISGGPGPADLLTIVLGTGAATIVGSTGIQAGSLQFGMDGQLYAGGTGNDGGDLFRIDKGTGASTFVGATGFANVTGLTLVGEVSVPEPTTIMLLGLGLAGLGFVRKRLH